MKDWDWSLGWVVRAPGESQWRLRRELPGMSVHFRLPWQEPCPPAILAELAGRFYSHACALAPQTPHSAVLLYRLEGDWLVLLAYCGPQSLFDLRPVARLRFLGQELAELKVEKKGKKPRRPPLTK